MSLGCASGVTHLPTVGCQPDVSGGRQPPHDTCAGGALPVPPEPPALLPQPGKSHADRDSPHPTSKQELLSLMHLQSPKPLSLGPLSRSPRGGWQQPPAPLGAGRCRSPVPRGGAGTWRCCRTSGPALASPPGQEGGGHPPAPPGLAIDRTQLPTPALPPITPRLRAAPAPPLRAPAPRQPRLKGNVPGSPLTTLFWLIPNAGIHFSCCYRYGCSSTDPRLSRTFTKYFLPHSDLKFPPSFHPNFPMATSQVSSSVNPFCAAVGTHSQP